MKALIDTDFVSWWELRVKVAISQPPAANRISIYIVLWCYYKMLVHSFESNFTRWQIISNIHLQFWFLKSEFMFPGPVLIEYEQKERENCSFQNFNDILVKKTVCNFKTPSLSAEFTLFTEGINIQFIIWPKMIVNNELASYKLKLGVRG